MSGVVCIVCPFAGDGKLNNIHVDIAFLILLAFISGNSSLEPLLEGLFAQIHIDLS